MLVQLGLKPGLQPSVPPCREGYKLARQGRGTLEGLEGHGLDWTPPMVVDAAAKGVDDNGADGGHCY